MEKLKVLLILLLTASLGLAVSILALAVVFAPNESPFSVLSGIVPRDISPALPIFFVPLSVFFFISIVLASVVGIIYYLVLPEMKSYVSGNGKETTSIVLRTLKPEERSVVNVLYLHGGTYLQKFITKETGLSRLKTHRVVAALSERGIVKVFQKGNTNEVSLEKWFQEGMR
jgi:uncharacterized membrane protein